MIKKLLGLFDPILSIFRLQKGKNPEDEKTRRKKKNGKDDDFSDMYPLW